MSNKRTTVLLISCKDVNPDPNPSNLLGFNPSCTHTRITHTHPANLTMSSCLLIRGIKIIERGCLVGTLKVCD